MTFEDLQKKIVEDHIEKMREMLKEMETLSKCIQATQMRFELS